MRLPSRGRGGFTLIELLVVIAIIAVLIGLLLPAVQKVRESSARSACSNNLHNLALAVHAYHDQQGFLPCNAGPGYSYNTTSPYSWSWLARVLPFMEQDNLYKACGVPTATIAAAGANVATAVKSYLCPSDLAINGQPRTNEANIGPTAVGQTNYKGVCGSNWAWGTYTNTGPSGNNNGLDAGDGIFFRTDAVGGHGPLKIQHIRDGTANTFMIGEDVPTVNQHCDWPFFNHATGTCSIPLNNAMQPGQPGYNNIGDWGNVYSFRSNHSGGANFAMGDASVQYVSESIDINLYRALATYSGKEPVSLP